MTLLLGALLLVLLLACANVGNLLLARGLARTREMAVRMWLGAGRGRLVRQLLTEALLLALAAGAIGLGIAFAVPRLILMTAGSSDLVRADRFSLDLPVFAFATGASILACAAAGLAPALGVTRAVSRMRGEDLKRTISAGSGRVRGSLLAAQVALTVVLLVSAGLLTRGLNHAISTDVSFAAVDEVQIVSIRPPADARPRLAELARTLRSELAAAGLPDLAFADDAPLSTASRIVTVRGFAEVPEVPGVRHGLELRPVSSSYFDVLGIPVLDGRTLPDEGTRYRAVLNESAARLLWPGERAVGQQLIGPGLVGSTVARDSSEVYEVVGVVRDVPVRRLTMIAPVMYVRSEAPLPALVVRSQSPADTALPIRSVVQALLPGAEITSRSLRDAMRDTLGDSMMGSRIAWAIGLLALVLATAGIAGVFAYSVEERRREIGVRMAIGARAPQVVRLLLAGAARPLVTGLLAGLLLSAGAGALLRSYLHGLSPLDPVAYLQVGAILLLAGMSASWFPARRATRIDPAVTLRAD